MGNPTDVHPISEFTSDTPSYVRRLKRTGQAETLATDEGSVIVQDAEAYRKQMLELDQRRLEMMMLEGLASEAVALTPEQLSLRLRARLNEASK